MSSWRMCADFKDLNKACLKDGYPLPEIDWKVESLCGFPFKCFLDAYKGYHQIQMAKEDEDKTAFITSQGIFCYTKMPFRLRNAGATYQHLVDKAFHKQIGRNLKVFVDDLVIKSRTEDEIVRDIEETFKTLREINMKLSPKKCCFKSFVPKVLKRCAKVEWKARKPEQTAEAEEAMVKVGIIVYLAATKETASAVLMTEREAKQMPIYFVSRVLSRPEVARRLQKWSIELGEYAIHYRPRVSVKGQILVDFIVKRPEEESSDTLMKAEEALPKPWILFTDGSSCTYGFGAGLLLINTEGMEFTYALRFRFDATNNEAKYEALIAGLRIAEQMGVKNLQANVDSRLVANQVNGTYIAKEFDLIRYLEKVRALTNSFKAFSIRQVPRSENKKADVLSKITSTSFAHLSKQVLVEELKEKSISEVEILVVVEEEGNTWMTPIFEYLTDETLPADVKEARAVRRKPWLRCVGPLQANYVLREIHEGSYSMHAGTRSVMAKASRIGYYWPTMYKDARVLIRACGDCQVHKLVPRIPHQKLTLIMSPWPFYKWGIDIAEPFSEGPGKVKFLIVAIDYFTKWIEAKPVATITGNQIKEFVWENIVSLEINLDLLEEKREQAAIREAKSKAKMEKYYNSKVQSTRFKPGNLVYRNNDASRAEDTGKLGSKWEGQYEVTEAIGKGAYKLRDRDRNQLPRTWNVSNLKKCYIHKM
ncbi:reverse transcriptase domain-containing protein [Tanacetum coccineum]|uniref:Reverse transcriptase domain-containing protein n=1 Tax=Tanacetum coccineum TaxID=301880 RepID=A0ABQ5F8A6_9ASTR